MTADEIKRGESEVLEFKGNELSEDPKKWLKTAIAFANGKGGSIVFGVEDSTFKITGVPSVNVFKFMEYTSASGQQHARQNLKRFAS